MLSAARRDRMALAASNACPPITAASVGSPVTITSDASLIWSMARVRANSSLGNLHMPDDRGDRRGLSGCDQVSEGERAADGGAESCLDKLLAVHPSHGRRRPAWSSESQLGIGQGAQHSAEPSPPISSRARRR
jgi:hypothetical protein